MTPEIYGSWLLQAAMPICVLAGLGIVIVTIRTSWLLKAIAWATVSFALIGGTMILAPKWTTIALEWGEFKANIAKLEEENARLVAANASFKQQIETVAQLGSDQFKTAKDAVATIAAVRDKVGWADFLPASGNYRLEIAPNNANFAHEIATKLNASPADVSKAFEESGYTVLKQPTTTDLENNPPRYLWVTPRQQ
jgi:hypothetical protein